ncbi:MAG: hypothetical protein PHI83_06355 [Sphaerochaetaceae bacterium]|jgi:hypothetical protein|nr:hypothetical protein [Sphaerochaetaceae bacterium]
MMKKPILLVFLLLILLAPCLAQRGVDIFPFDGYKFSFSVDDSQMSITYPEELGSDYMAYVIDTYMEISPELWESFGFADYYWPEGSSLYFGLARPCAAEVIDKGLDGFVWLFFSEEFEGREVELKSYETSKGTVKIGHSPVFVRLETEEGMGDLIKASDDSAPDNLHARFFSENARGYFMADASAFSALLEDMVDRYAKANPVITDYLDMNTTLKGLWKIDGVRVGIEIDGLGFFFSMEGEHVLHAAQSMDGMPGYFTAAADDGLWIFKEDSNPMRSSEFSDVINAVFKGQRLEKLIEIPVIDEQGRASFSALCLFISLNLDLFENFSVESSYFELDSKAITISIVNKELSDKNLETGNIAERFTGFYKALLKKL